MSAPEPRLDAVLETCLYHDSSERDAMERFYGEVLGLAQTTSWPDGIAFRIGTGVVLLFDRERLAGRGGPIKEHGTSGAGHACFVVERSTYEPWKERLAEAGTRVIHEQEWPRGGKSFYFEDPAGNLLEIADQDLWAR